jgi:probable F420-dependent oxidoreductase
VKPVTFSVPLFPFDRFGGVEGLARGVARADELGYHAVSFPDHVIMPVREGAPRISTMWYDPCVLTAYLAARTRRIRFLYNALVFPYRPAIQLAKALSTTDVVSGGRLIVGVASGWLRGEFRTLGVPYAERGAITDEYLRAMKLLWTRENPEFEGRYVSFRDIAFEPKCLQRPHVPLWIAGQGPIPLRRVVEHGDGWTPMVGSREELARGGDWIREQLRARGRDPESVTFAYGISFGEPDPVREAARSHASHGVATAPRAVRSPQEIADQIGALREIGFSHIGLSFGWNTLDDYERELEFFAGRVMPQFA